MEFVWSKEEITTKQVNLIAYICSLISCDFLFLATHFPKISPSLLFDGFSFTFDVTGFYAYRFVDYKVFSFLFYLMVFLLTSEPFIHISDLSLCTYNKEKYFTLSLHKICIIN